MRGRQSLISALRVAAGLLLSVAVIGSSAAQAPEAQERRIALLIGNSNYQDPTLPSLANSERDVRLLEGSFRQAGFEVQIALNLTASGLRARLSSFGERARTSDVAMIYYAGGGLATDGIDYIAATDARVAGGRPASFEEAGFVALNEVVNSVQPATKFRMIILDSSRDDPFQLRTRGLVPVGDLAVDSDVMILYGSAMGAAGTDGIAGGNSPVAAAIARRMLEPSIEIGLFARRVRSDVLRATQGSQRPQLYGELGEREFYFVGGPPPEVRPLIVSNQPRLALIIGNSDYNMDQDTEDDWESHAVLEEGFSPDLPNPANDAPDLAAALQRLGFQVTLVQNADLARLTMELLNFEEQILEAGEDAIVIVYYAGHAIQVGGANFLVPVNSKMPAIDFDRFNAEQAEFALAQYALPVQTALLGRLHNPSSRGLNLIILDACRENPWERRTVGRGGASRSTARASGRSRGLGDVRIDLRRTALAFATKPGDVADDGSGRNSPYTTALLAHVNRPGQSVLQLLNRVGAQVETDTEGRQIPWSNAPSLGETCLGACPTIQ